MLLAILPMCGHHEAVAPPSDMGADTADTADTAACVPGAEVCNGADDDCDGAVDEDPVDGIDLYPDADGDGHGTTPSSGRGCSAIAGYSTTDGDCDDGDASVNPAAAEDCVSAADDDCDGDANGADSDCVSAVYPAASARAQLVGTSWIQPLHGDVDGDGFADLALGYDPYTITTVPTSGVVDVTTSSLATWDGYRWGVGDDFDGDGLVDLLGTQMQDGEDYSTVMVTGVYSSPLSGTITTPDVSHSLTYREGVMVGTWAASLGDVDGDGLRDAMQIERGYGGGALYCVSTGCSSGTVSDEFTNIPVVLDLGDRAGDLDGDGYDDVVFADTSWYSETVVYYSPAVSGWGTIGATLTYVDIYDSPSALRGPGDIDGDGYDDLLVTDPTQTSVLLGPIADGEMHGVAWASFAASWVADAADVDGDGTVDLLAGVPVDRGSGVDIGALYVVRGVGPGAWDATSADARVEGAASGDGVGMTLAVLDDQDGDGAADVAIGGLAQTWIFGAL